MKIHLVGFGVVFGNKVGDLIKGRLPYMVANDAEFTLRGSMGHRMVLIEHQDPVVAHKCTMTVVSMAGEILEIIENMDQPLTQIDFPLRPFTLK